jgi:hypothetical protein
MITPCCEHGRALDAPCAKCDLHHGVAGALWAASILLGVLALALWGMR